MAKPVSKKVVSRPAHSAPEKAPEQKAAAPSGGKEYDNTNRGVLFQNDRKESETHPDLKGNINVDGKEYWISAWEKEYGNEGKTLISLSVQPK